MGSADTAALQVALRAAAVYTGAVDGFFGPETSQAVARLQQHLGLPVTGTVGPLTKAALGVYAQASFGSRILEDGMSGWDVAALQFLLAWHGFPSATFDGVFSVHTRLALDRFEQWAGLPVDGVAGPLVFAALQAPPPVARVHLAWPLELPVADGFGPRGNRFHAGIDIPAPSGAAIAAAIGGRVVYAGWRDGGWGNEVTVASGGGIREIYAHMSLVDVRLGEVVGVHQILGEVGQTGDATGPHLHFELRVRGAAADPLPALPPEAAPSVPDVVTRTQVPLVTSQELSR